MDWQDGTGGGVQLQREAYHPASLAYESVSGERWVEGIETAGSRSTGESRRLSTGVLPRRKQLVPQRRVPRQAIQRRRLCLQLCIDEMERARENIGDPFSGPIALLRLGTTFKHFGTCWKAIHSPRRSKRWLTCYRSRFATRIWTRLRRANQTQYEVFLLSCTTIRTWTIRRQTS